MPATPRGFILAAGLGTRLRPLTETLPKPLVPIAGEPLIVRAIRQLAAVGITEIGVNLFHLGDLIRDRLSDGSGLGVQLTWFDERPQVLGTGGGLKQAEAFLRGGGSDHFVLCNADVWHDFDLRTVLAAHHPGQLATLAVHRCVRRPELHTVVCRQERPNAGHIVQIGGDLDALPPGDFAAIYSGIAVYGAQLFDWLPAAKVCGLVSHGLLPAMAAGQTVRWVEPAGTWFDCGTHAEVLRAAGHALRMRAMRRGQGSSVAMARVA